jgi:uncharacterized Zn-binding protein involved in type VI secretion
VVDTASGVSSPVPLPFSGPLADGLEATVLIGGHAAAVLGSGATNTPAHVPPPNSTFAAPPTNKATILAGSATVLIGDKPAARHGDQAQTCSEGPPVGTVVVAGGTVDIGP